MPYTYPYPRPAVTADVVVLQARDGELETLLIRRRAPPFEGRFALPGGFLDLGEDLDQAARRELLEETGLKVRSLIPVGAYGKPGRDPRGPTVSVAFLHLRVGPPLEPRAGDDALEAEFRPARRPPPLAFDHRRILRDALALAERLCEDEREWPRFTSRSTRPEPVRDLWNAVSGRAHTLRAVAKRLHSR